MLNFRLDTPLISIAGNSSSIMCTPKDDCLYRLIKTPSGLQLTTMLSLDYAQRLDPSLTLTQNSRLIMTMDDAIQSLKGWHQELILYSNVVRSGLESGK